MKKSGAGRLQAINAIGVPETGEPATHPPWRRNRQAGGESRFGVSLLGEYCQQQIALTRNLCSARRNVFSGRSPPLAAGRHAPKRIAATPHRAYALKLGLLGSGTLAVHGTQLDAQEVEVLAASGAALCLCPRSNRNLGVGVPPVRELMESGALLCLGTDGLTSNRDLDVRKEAVWLRETMLTAIATAAAVGLPIALAGTAGYVVNGWNVAGIPGPHIGYVYIPALLGIIVVSVLTAPLGAKLAHTLPVAKLKKIFAVLLFIVGTRMLWTTFM